MMSIASVRGGVVSDAAAQTRRSGGALAHGIETGEGHHVGAAEAPPTERDHPCRLHAARSRPARIATRAAAIGLTLLTVNELEAISACNAATESAACNAGGPPHARARARLNAPRVRQLHRAHGHGRAPQRHPRSRHDGGRPDTSARRSDAPAGAANRDRDLDRMDLSPTPQQAALDRLTPV